MSMYLIIPPTLNLQSMFKWMGVQFYCLTGRWKANSTMQVLDTPHPTNLFIVHVLYTFLQSILYQPPVLCVYVGCVTNIPYVIYRNYHKTSTASVVYADVSKTSLPPVCYHGDMVDWHLTESKNVNIREQINGEPELLIHGQLPTLSDAVLTGSTRGKALNYISTCRLKHMNINNVVCTWDSKLL